MNVLVTGANGFLGSWLCRRLQDDGHRVFALVRQTSDLSELEGVRYEKVFGDVTDRASLDRAFQGMDAVFHLAGLIAYKKSELERMKRINVEGTRNVVEACLAAKVPRLVHLSSITAVGAGFTPDEIQTETSKYNIADLHLGYFDTKHDAEKIVIEATRRGLDAVILNPGTIYGPGDAKKGSRSTQVKVARGRFPFYTTGGVNVIHVEDAVEGIVAAWKRGRAGERYLLGGENLPIKTLFEMIASEAGVPAPKWKLPRAVLFAIGTFGDLKNRFGGKASVSVENAWSSTLYHYLDNSKAKRELGLKPRPAREAIRASVVWMKDHGLLDR